MRLAVLGLTMAAALPATGASAADGGEPRERVKDAVYRTVDGRPLHLDISVHPDAGKIPGPVLIHFLEIAPCKPLISRLWLVLTQPSIS